MKRRKLIIYLNAPITLTFVAMCTIAYLLGIFTNGSSTSLVFSTYGSSFLSPMTYVRLIGHVFGHASWSHLINNMMYILLLGPILEEKYRDRLIYVIIVVAVVTGLIHNFIQPNVALLGASGVVFAFILLASVTGDSQGIPVTLIIVAILWIGGEVFNLTLADNVSQLTHIIGGAVGGLIGMAFKRR